MDGPFRARQLKRAALAGKCEGCGLPKNGPHPDCATFAGKEKHRHQFDPERIGGRCLKCGMAQADALAWKEETCPNCGKPGNHASGCSSLGHVVYPCRAALAGKKSP